MESVKYDFEKPVEPPIIKVMGIGGGGSNAVSYMYNQGIKGVDFYVCNTDIQALKSSPVSNKIQIGKNLTEGLGAGADPEVGRNAAMESKDEIQEVLKEGTKMLFITAGMGGGTGTGAAPVIAQIAKEIDILTVVIVTMPFGFEGKPKARRAKEGIDEITKYCDTLIVILNEKIREIYGQESVRLAFNKTDAVLTTAAKSIAELITFVGIINVDFRDVRTVMKSAGTAVMGSGTAEGEGRAQKAVEEAIVSPLLNHTDIRGARSLLLNMVVGDEETFQMTELDHVTDFIHELVGEETECIFGYTINAALGDAISVIIVATKFENEADSQEDTDEAADFDNIRRFKHKPKKIDNQKKQPATKKLERPAKKVFDLAEGFKIVNDGSGSQNKRKKAIGEMTPSELKTFRETPAYMRKGMLNNEHNEPD